MWLLPLFGTVCRLVCQIFYRLRVGGAAAPQRGPLLLVANHPNALLDPALVVVAAGRPVRFLAKAPLFTQTGVGWLVRGVGSIPVYRAVDSPGETRRNSEMFRAVWQALEKCAAIGLFPEGTSHSDPEIKPLKTGAARIALGAFEKAACDTAIVPVGLVLRSKQTFRSEALALLGEPIKWRDLAERGESDVDAVRELTQRIDEGLRRVTLNLEEWEDGPLIETAEAIYRAGRREASEADEEWPGRVERLNVASEILRARRRSTSEPTDPELAGDLETYSRKLTSLGITPGVVASRQTLRRSLTWAMRRLYLIGPPILLIALVGHVLFWLPFRSTGWMSGRLAPSLDQVATYKVLCGAVLYTTWVAVLAAVGGWWLASGETVVAAALAGALLLVLPAVGLSGLLIRERWRALGKDLRRFLVIRRRNDLATLLRREQDDLEQRIECAVERHLAGSAGLE